MKGIYKNISIKGVSAAVPNYIFSNEEYAENAADKKIKKQIKLTGILERRMCENGQTASDLAIVAAKRLLNELKWDLETISVMIFVTQSPDLQRPSTAFMIQKAMGIGEDCLVFDINMGCSGYTGGLITICSILENMKGRGLLLVGESWASRVEKNRYLLDGDAASATALEYEKDSDSIEYVCKSDGSRVDLLYKSFYNKGFMDGNAVLLFGLNDVAESVREYLKDREDKFEIDYYVFHQAQRLIVSGVADEAGLEQGKLLNSCQKYGNTSSASIPLSIVVNKESLGDSKKRVLMCGFGIGLSWSIVEATIDGNTVLPLIETDYVCEENDLLRRN